MAAVEERKILYRKSAALFDLELSKEQIESFFEDGFLPMRLQKNFKTLKTAPNAKATHDLISALRTHGREGTVQRLIELLEATDLHFMDELLAELALAHHDLPIEEHIRDEMATLTHREYGDSRKLGPVDQKAIRQMLMERTTVRHNASQNHLLRENESLKAELTSGRKRQRETQRQGVRLEEFMRQHNIRHALSMSRVGQRQPKLVEVVDNQPEVNVGEAGSEPLSEAIEEQADEDDDDPSSMEPYQELSNLLEDLFSHLDIAVSEIERRRGEKERLVEVIEQTEQGEFLEDEPVHTVLARIIRKQNEDMKTVKTKLRVVDVSMGDVQAALNQAKRDRPGKVATKIEKAERIREKLKMAKEASLDMKAKEQALKAEIEMIRPKIDDSRQKFGFLAASRTVKLIRRRSQNKFTKLTKRVMQKAKADDADDADMPPAYNSQDFVRGSRSMNGKIEYEDSSGSDSDEPYQSSNANGIQSLQRSGNGFGNGTKSTPRHISHIRYQTSQQ